MSEFIIEILPLIEKIAPYLGTALTAIIFIFTFIFYAIKKEKKEKALQEQLEAAKARETYIRCPKCHEKLPLSSVSFYLPGELVDNNLDGKPDNN